jgi:hypothetical protein
VTDGATATTDPTLPRVVGTGPAGRGRKRFAAIVIACTLLPFLASGIRLAAGAGSGFHPFADQATIESLVRDVGDHWLLVGPYSRFGWFHPGPALYYLLAVPYRLSGGSSGSLAFASVCLNAAAVLGILLVARRRGGMLLLLISATFVLLLVRTLGAQFLRDPWNPYITLLPLLLLVFLVWTLACGDRWALPVSVGVASFVTQTHVGYAPLVAALLVTGFLALFRHERAVAPTRVLDGSPRRSWWSTMAWTAGVVIVLWFPVVFQQIARDPGNLSELLDFFGNHGREQQYRDAWHVLALELDVWPDWLSGDSATSVIGTVDFTRALPVPVALLALVGATVVTWRARLREALRLDCIVLVAIAVSFVSLTRVVGEVYSYLVRWTWALGAATWIAIAWSVVAWWRARDRVSIAERRVARGAALGLVAVFAVITVVDVVAAGRAGTPEPELSAAMGRLGDAAAAALPHGDGAVELRVRGGEGAYWTSAGVADVLEHHDIDVRVGPELEFAYGPHRLVHGDRLRARVVVADESTAAGVRALPGSREVAREGDVIVFVAAS